LFYYRLSRCAGLGHLENWQKGSRQWLVVAFDRHYRCSVLTSKHILHSSAVRRCTSPGGSTVSVSITFNVISRLVDPYLRRSTSIASSVSCSIDTHGSVCEVCGDRLGLSHGECSKHYDPSEPELLGGTGMLQWVYSRLVQTGKLGRNISSGTELQSITRRRRLNQVISTLLG
jgi:hypothetical protein